MRGSDGYNEDLFTTTGLGDFVPANHRLWTIRMGLIEALAAMDERLSAM